MSCKLELVVFDWAGTTVDFGCFAPVAAFIESFARYQIHVSLDQAREPMGLHKREHIRAMTRMPEIAEQWKQVHGRECSDQDVDEIYQQHFVPLQVEVAVQHSTLIPGLLETVQYLRQRGVRIGTTTGYFRDAAQLVYQAAQQQGYQPDFNVCAEDVPVARPAPWMIYRNMEALNIYPPQAVLKVGDTVPDILEGVHAGVIAVGVTHSSSDVGMTLDEFQAADEGERQARIERVQNKMIAAGAAATLPTIAELPQFLEDHAGEFFAALD